MKQKISAIFMVLAAMLAMLFSASLAHAGQITATHTILSQKQTASGAEVTVQITINNQGGLSLSSVSLDLIEPIGATLVGSSSVALGNLANGASVSKTLTVSIPGPGLVLMPALMFDGSGADSQGAVSHFPLLSQEQ